MPSGDPVPGKIHCPYCAHDISFMKDAFGRQTYFTVPVTATSTFTLPSVAVQSTPDDAVYSRDLQDLLWERMREKAALYAQMGPDEVIANAVAQKRANREDGSVVLHLMFDKDVAPMGGLVNKAIMGASATMPPIRPDTDVVALNARGYALVDKGGALRIQTVDDVPVGPLWNVLQYWGGERHHKRWHMERPIHASPHRNDCPAFMDGPMCSVQVWYRDDEMVKESLDWLYSNCVAGINGSPAPGRIRAIMLG